MNVMTSGLMGPSDTVEWGTPQDLYDKLDAEFHFTLDVCASDGMQKCERYFNPQTDGLKQVWGGGGSMLHESTLRTGYREVGAQGCGIASHHRRTIASQDGHEMVSEVGTALCFRGPFHQGQGKVRRLGHGRTVPVHYRDMEHSAHAEIRGD